ncbi:Techylectin-5A [Araneus ventricosus]|uniref:Techylectin-5A n=1 Tax=Araneus ventricosus TaxID=182803 RepID=A0A4Y2R662_ARAVE|nr:Techylectin-5A [Araneus ventricosus]
MAAVYAILLLLLLSPVKLEANPSECERKEKYFTILSLAEESVSIARLLHPDCGEDNNFINSSKCCQNDRVTANLDIALNLMSKAKANYQDCGGGNYVTNEEYATSSPIEELVTSSLNECTDDDKEFEDILSIITPRFKDNLANCEPKTVVVNNTQTVWLHKNPMDCSEILENGRNKSGEHRVWLRNRIMKGKGAKVFCDMETDGGGWTVIQRRGQFGNGEDYFVRTWDQYKHGFGSLTEEFWLGNDKIFALTNQGQYSVRFDMTDVNGTSAFAEYKVFWIENEENKYKLHISKYSGNAEYFSVWKFGARVAAQVSTLSSHCDSKFRARSQSSSHIPFFKKT